MTQVLSRAGQSTARPSSADKAIARRSQSWKQGTVAVACAGIAILLIFHDTVFALLKTWQSGSFSHCYLILPISLYLIWERRESLASVAPRIAPGGLVALSLLALAWLVGNIAGVLFVQEFALVAMLPALAWTLLGTMAVRVMVFPLAFLFFAVPAGLSLIAPLQGATAHIAVRALDLSGVPVLREGYLLILPNGAWEIAQECSGIRFLIACVTLGTLSAFLLYRSWIRRLIFIGASIVVPIVANGLRAYGIIMLGYLSNNRLAKGVDHLIYGWLFFSFVLAFLLATGWHWRQDTSPKAPVAETRPAAQGVDSNRRAITRVGCAVAAVVLVALGPLSAHALFPTSGQAASPYLAPLPASAPWTADSSVQPAQENAPHISGASAGCSQEYSLGEGKVELYVAYNPAGTAKKLVPPDNLFLNPEKWVVASERFRIVQLDGEPIEANETLLHLNEAERLIWNFYWVDGQFTASPLRSRFLEAENRLFSHQHGEAAVAVSTEVRTNAKDAADLLQNFLDHQALRSYLERAGS